MSETFARVYLANAHDVLSTIVFIHSVTGVVALRSILPYLSGQSHRNYCGTLGKAVVRSTPLLDNHPQVRKKSSRHANLVTR